MIIDGIIYDFAQGRFDSWQVYNEINGRRNYPFDTDYLRDIKVLKTLNNCIYDEYVDIYDITRNCLDASVIELICEKAIGYGDSEGLYKKTFINLYMTMIAEENRRNTRLGKRIKRLAVHRVLEQEESIEFAANECRGLGWREISDRCSELGF